MVCFKALASILATVSAAQAAQLLNFENKQDVVANSYLVMMHDGMSAHDFKTHVEATAKACHVNAKRDGSIVGGVKHKYDVNGWRGYSGTFDKATLEALTNDPNVKYIEPDRVVRTFGWKVQEKAPSWGLGRISHRAPNMTDFVYEEIGGAGVTIYSLDTGVEITHPEFEGRATWGANFLTGSEDIDDSGHGTHTAATAAGKTFGVAKNANVIAIKVLNDKTGGTIATILAGFDWAINHARETGVAGKAVMNVSLGTWYSAIFNAAATRVVESGIFMAAAAGNHHLDASRFSPGSAQRVCTVGATSLDDTKPRWSNYGPRVDIFAPGDGILSAYKGNSTSVHEGTSMSAPHVVGVAATLISEEEIPVFEICDRLKIMATEAVMNAGVNTTTKLLYNGSGF